MTHSFPKDSLPIVAILRGADTHVVLQLTEILIEAGITLIEVTFNSPNVLRSLAALNDRFHEQAVIGAGTVRSSEQVQEVAARGGKFIVSSYTNPDVIHSTKKHGLISIPGATTPTEIHSALKHGADIVKIFPCFMVKPKGIRAIRATLPPEVKLLPTGSIIIPTTPPPTSATSHAKQETIFHYLQAGCWGIGLASNLYQPGTSMATVKANAEHTVQAVRAQLPLLTQRHPSW